MTTDIKTYMVDPLLKDLNDGYERVTTLNYNRKVNYYKQNVKTKPIRQ